MLGQEGLLISDNIYDAESGHFISAHHQRIAELVAEYNPELRVVWIPNKDRQPGQTMPFGIAHFPRNKEPYIFIVLSEAEMNHPTAALEKLILADQGRGSGNSVFNRLHAQMDAAQLMREKEAADRRAEAQDKALSMFRSTNSRYRLGKGRTVDLAQ